MQIEQNSFIIGDMGTASPGATKGYVDLARAYSALTGRSICQTKRSDGKYKPLSFMVRVRALFGDATIETLNNGYPTRNSVVLAGAARDAMLKSAGVSRGNLETYQKELRIVMDADQARTNTWLPGATAPGLTEADTGAAVAAATYGIDLVYDHTSLVYDDPSSPGTDVSKTLCMLGGAITDGDFLPVVYNWTQWRHNFTPSAAADDIADNAFSYAMQQSSTADKIIDIVEGEADEKPYNLSDFTTKVQTDIIGTGVGNPASSVISCPLGLMRVTTGSSGATLMIELVGVSEL